MLLLFGGTTEGKKVADILEEQKKSYWYSTFSNTGFTPGSHGQVRSGPFSKEDLIRFCKNNQINAIIDAAHPFAEELHQTISKASVELNIPVIRWRRPQPARTPSNTIIYRKTLDALAKEFHVRKRYQWLNLTGIKSIQTIQQLNAEGTNYFRIMPRQQSREEARNARLNRHQIIEGYPATSEEEKKLWTQLGVDAVITKENGFTGKLPEKMEAARQSDVLLGILEEPDLPEHFQTIDSKEELLPLLNA